MQNKMPLRTVLPKRGIPLALLVLTLFSARQVSGVFSKFITYETQDAQAVVAYTGGVTLTEHKPVLQSDSEKMTQENTLYSLSDSIVSTSVSYLAIPGVTIPKDPFVTLDGKNQVSCMLYLEIAEDSLGFMTFALSEDWEEDLNLTPAHGGTVYRYSKEIPPYTQGTISDILRNNCIRIRDTYANKRSDTHIPKSFTMEMYAYLVQCN